MRSAAWGTADGAVNVYIWMWFIAIVAAQETSRFSVHDMAFENNMDSREFRRGTVATERGNNDG